MVTVVVVRMSASVPPCTVFDAGLQFSESKHDDSSEALQLAESKWWVVKSASGNIQSMNTNVPNGQFAWELIPISGQGCIFLGSSGACIESIKTMTAMASDASLLKGHVACSEILA